MNWGLLHEVMIFKVFNSYKFLTAVSPRNLSMISTHFFYLPDFSIGFKHTYGQIILIPI